jgi:hypothetical protein
VLLRGRLVAVTIPLLRHHADCISGSYNKPWYLVTNTVIGAGSLRTYPILFRNVALVRGGDERRPVEADVKRGDRFRRIGG